MYILAQFDLYTVASFLIENALVNIKIIIHLKGHPKEFSFVTVLKKVSV